MHLPLSFPEFPVQAEGSLLGKARRMCPASSLDTTVGLGPPVPHWADDHGLLSSPPVPPPHGCQSNSPYMASLAHTFPTPLACTRGLLDPRPCSLLTTSALALPHPSCSQSCRSLQGLALQLRVSPLALPGRLAFAPRSQVLKFSRLPPSLSWVLPHLCSGNTSGRGSVGKWVGSKLEGQPCLIRCGLW